MFYLSTPRFTGLHPTLKPVFASVFLCYLKKHVNYDVKSLATLNIITYSTPININNGTT